MNGSWIRTGVAAATLFAQLLWPAGARAQVADPPTVVSAGTLLSRLPLAGGLASRASNSRDAQLNEATRRAVDAATQSLINSAHRLFTPR
jgi:hypothetical protein